jgi:hypothetical protein
MRRDSRRAGQKTRTMPVPEQRQDASIPAPGPAARERDAPLVTPLHGAEEPPAGRLQLEPLSPPAEGTPEQAREAFTILGLDPSADADLVELAYWHHVDVCRATLLGGPTWRARMAAINHARALLASIARDPSSAAPDESAAPQAGAEGGGRRTAAAFLPPLALMAFIVVTRAAGWDRGAIAAGGFAVLAIAAFAGVVVSTLAGRTSSPPAALEVGPYRRLCVLPSADQALVTIAYRHLLRVASAHGDVDALDALEAAYARLGTPAARTAYDLRSAETDALMLSEPAPPSVPPPGPRRAWPNPAPMVLSMLVTGAWGLRRLRRAPPRPRPVARWDDEDKDPTPLSRPFADAAAHVLGTLRVLDGENEIVTVVLRDLTVYAVGSNPDADVLLPAADDVAAEHARITVRRGRVLFHHVAEDADSFINGERAVWAVLEPGDTVRIGAYRCQYLAPAIEARPAPFLRDLPRD